jgi:hypothetical protein
MNVQYVRIKLWLAIGLAMLAGVAPADAAQQITQKESNSQSIELTNLDEPDGGTEAAAAVPNPVGAVDGAASVEPVAAAPRERKEQTSADTVASPVKVPEETPMEKYRDSKLLQAATPNTGNHATARRYLKVDRATFLEAAGLQ